MLFRTGAQLLSFVCSTALFVSTVTRMDPCQWVQVANHFRRSWPLPPVLPWLGENPPVSTSPSWGQEPKWLVRTCYF